MKLSSATAPRLSGYAATGGAGKAAETLREVLTGLAAKVLLDKWSARGCNPAVLARIRSEVFNIAEPTLWGQGRHRCSVCCR